MPEQKPAVLKLSSVPLTREKQILVQEELSRYGEATNWVIKTLMKNNLVKRAEIIKAIEDQFHEKFDKRPTYLNDVVKTACSEIARHRKLAVTVRSMRDKIPFFKQGRAIFSQPIVKISETAVLLTLADRTQIPIPYDKFSRNQNAEAIMEIVKGEPIEVDTKGKPAVNMRYDRIRLTWNNEGFLNIDLRANLQASRNYTPQEVIAPE